MLTEEERALLDADELVFGKHVRNRTIFTGDNLDVLRGMNDDCIDLIYLDPPFNSNAEYENPFDKGVRFHDIWSWSKVRQDWLNTIAWNQPALHAIIAAASFTAGEHMQAYLAYMVVRLIEMRRVLKKETGSIYLHCDDNAMHYLKPCMDFIFSQRNYQATIVWKRTSAHNDAKTWGRVTDFILHYGAPPKNIRKVRVGLERAYQSHFYRFGNPNEGFGQWSVGDLTGPMHGTSGGESGLPWRGIDPVERAGRCWSVPRTGDYAEWVEENLIHGYTSIESVHARLDALDAAGLILRPDKPDGVPRLKRYLAGSRGQIPTNNWTDIRPVPRSEDTGYPTQKPLALLRRIIAANTDEGDVVLDPFCGCATACVAAETMTSPSGQYHERRKWIGIDVSAEAYSQVVERLEKTAKLTDQDAGWRLGLVHHKALEYEPLITETKRRRGVEKVIVHQWSLVGGDAPVRSDNLVEGAQPPDQADVEDPFELRTKLHRSSDERIRAARYFQQNGRCAADGESLPERHLTIDHIVATANNGPDVDANIQLLCHGHNSMKQDGTMADLDRRMRAKKETPWLDRPNFIAQAEEWFLPPHQRKPLPLRGLGGGD